MELLCIKSHSKGYVKFGVTYPFISDKMPCNCKDSVDVGIKRYSGTRSFDRVVIPLTIGQSIICSDCGVRHPFDGKQWICKSLFGEIGSQDESETYEKSKEYVDY